MTQFLTLELSLVVGFMKFIVAQVPRSKNLMLDALANLASNELYPYHVELNVMAHSLISSVAILTVDP